MALNASLTGSYPPVRLPPPPLTMGEIAASIQDAISKQKAATNGRDVQWIYVSGQPQNDIVGIFANGLELYGQGLPYGIAGPIEYVRPITMSELEVASASVGAAPLKAHVAGPMLLAEPESSKVFVGAPEAYFDPIVGRRQITLDFAKALATEIDLLTRTTSLGLAYVQIDEPTLALANRDLTLAREAIGMLAQASKVPTILHVCYDVSPIIDELLAMPVDILNLEWRFIRDISKLDKEALARSGKRLAIGCIPVDTDEVPSERQLEYDMLYAIDRFGPANIWGLTPDCGLRLSDGVDAELRLQRLVGLTQRLNTHFS